MGHQLQHGSALRFCSAGIYTSLLCCRGEWSRVRPRAANTEGKGRQWHYGEPKGHGACAAQLAAPSNRHVWIGDGLAVGHCVCLRKWMWVYSNANVDWRGKTTADAGDGCHTEALIGGYATENERYRIDEDCQASQQWLWKSLTEGEEALREQGKRRKAIDTRVATSNTTTKENLRLKVADWLKLLKTKTERDQGWPTICCRSIRSST